MLIWWLQSIIVLFSENNLFLFICYIFFFWYKIGTFKQHLKKAFKPWYFSRQYITSYTKDWHWRHGMLQILVIEEPNPLEASHDVRITTTIVDSPPTNYIMYVSRGPSHAPRGTNAMNASSAQSPGPPTKLLHISRFYKPLIALSNHLLPQRAIALQIIAIKSHP